MEEGVRAELAVGERGGLSPVMEDGKSIWNREKVSLWGKQFQIS